jgi:hypothetical protein
MLFSGEIAEWRMTFNNKSQNNKPSSFAWVDNISGDFLVSSTKVGALKLFNAA